MARTAEQIAADDALSTAIEAVHRAYHGDDGVEGVLTKWVVLAQRQWWDDAGDQFSANYSSPRNNNVPLSDLIGMTEYASARYKAIITQED